MTSAQLFLARFSLGLPNPNGVGRPRVYFCPKGEEEAAWRELADLGYATLSDVRGGFFVYSLNPSGARAALLPGETLDRRSFVDTAART
jgi:hypothetical protein